MKLLTERTIVWANQHSTEENFSHFRSSFWISRHYSQPQTPKIRDGRKRRMAQNLWLISTTRLTTEWVGNDQWPSMASPCGLGFLNRKMLTPSRRLTIGTIRLKGLNGHSFPLLSTLFWLDLKQEKQCQELRSTVLARIIIVWLLTKEGIFLAQSMHTDFGTDSSE